MQFLIYLSRRPSWARFQRMHRGWARAQYALPIVDPKKSLHYRAFMRKSKPRGRKPLWNAREPGRFRKLARVHYALPIVDPKKSLHYRAFMRKSKPRGRRPMFTITQMGIKRMRRFTRAFVNPPDPKKSLHYKPFMRKSKPRGRKPMWQITTLGTKRWKRVNRDYPLPFRQAFVPYVTPPGPVKWRNDEPSLAKQRSVPSLLSRFRKTPPKLED